MGRGRYSAALQTRSFPMRFSSLSIAACLVAASTFAGTSQAADCGFSFGSRLAAVYSVKRSEVDDAVMQRKLAEADEVWEWVKREPQLKPCLQRAIEAPGANPFLQLDGAFLLLESDRANPTYRQLFVDVAGRVPLEEVWNDAQWMAYLSGLAAEGFDVSRPGADWLAHPGRHFVEQTHFMDVGQEAGGVFLFGAMDEQLALPALLKLARDRGHPGRRAAIHLLGRLGLPESWQAMADIDLQGLDAATAVFVASLRPAAAPLLVPVAGKLTHEQLLATLDDWEQRHFLPRRAALVKQTPDYIARWAAVMGAQDLPRLRKLRRMAAATMREDALDYYRDISTLVLWLSMPGRQR